ncbi:MAG: flagellar biosynthesis protein FlhB [bacterium]
MAEQSGEKSEEPTPHKLREAREKGQVAKSKEVTTAALLLASFWMLHYTGANMWQNLSDMITSIFTMIPEATDFSFNFAAGIFFIGFRAFFAVLGPIFLVTFLLSLIVEALQTGFVTAVDPVMPKIEKLNPMEGLKKMFSMQGIVELIKSIIKIIIVFYITLQVVWADLPKVIMLLDLHPWNALILGAEITYTIAMRVGIFYIAIAILDYFYRRYEYMKNLRMTKQEVKEEYKRLEGDPLVKQRIREMQRAAAQQRMMSSVPKADVVVTNPTLIAVALSYDNTAMNAPQVLAKGERLMAQEIRAIAEEYKIPIIENVDLARALYKAAAVGEDIPLELYQAVAEVLAFVYKLRKQKAVERKRARVYPPITPGLYRPEAIELSSKK